MGLKHRVYEEWRDYTRGQVKLRKEHAACIYIQRVFRGHRGRKFYRRKLKRETRAALKISRLVRGHLGRQRYDFLLRQEQQRVRRLARNLRRESMRQQIEQLWRREKERLSAESQALDDVEPEALRQHKLHMRERAGARELKARAKQIQLTFAEEHHDSRSMTWRAAKREARVQIRDEALKAARAVAQAEFRKSRPVLIFPGESLEQVTMRFGGQIPT